ncbi:MAG: hypothetical protein JXJ22_02580 [Bacteroidales bacterium]|nr:hypothetical protein [Bacteroidales bacterium]
MEKFKDISPGLSELNKNPGYSVPEGYFENFSSRLSEKIHAEQAPGFFEKIINYTKPQMAFVSLFVGFFLVVFLVFKFMNISESGSQLTTSDITEYIEENIYYYNDKQLISSLETDNLVIEDQQKNDEIIDYLVNDGIDINSILDEF